MSQSEWFHSHHGRKLGPFTARQLRERADAGELRPEDLVLKEGTGRWVAAHTLKGLFPDPPPAPAPAPAPSPLVPVDPPPPDVPLADRVAALPKPVLFGLFGLAGGLLGAMLVGELLWLLLSPAGLKPLGPHVAAGVPRSLRVYAGGKNRLSVKVARQGFAGPLVVRPVSESPHVSSIIEDLDAQTDEAQLEIFVADAMPPGEHAMEVRIEGPPGVAPLTLPLTLEVEPMPAGLGVSVPPAVALEQGRRARFGVRLSRARFDGPARVRVAGAPQGVTVTSADVPAGKGECELEVTADAEAAVGTVPLSVRVTSEANGREVSAAEPFRLSVEKRRPPSVDVVFVLDLTGSMQFAINGIKSGIRSFADKLAESKIDAKLGLVGFRDLQSDKERPFALTFEGSPFTSDPVSFGQQVGTLRASGGGDAPESSLQGLALAANQPFRKGATRVLVLVTDAAPKVHKGEKISTVEQTAEELQKAEVAQVHLVTHPQHASKDYKKFKDDFDGSFFDLRTASKGDGFAALLPLLSKDIARITMTAVPKGSGRAIEPPPLPEAREATLPPPAEVPVIKAVQSTQAFAAKDRGRLLAATVVWTAVVAGAISLALVAGQRFHAKRAWVGLGAAGPALAGGLLAGLAGGLTGQLVFQSTSGVPAVEWLSRILGWSFLGGLVGVVMAFFVPNLKWTRGGAGGLAGGVFGAVAFLIVSLIVGGLLGRWLGAAILGFFLGLMVALAELVFRRFWLEVAVGAREVRALTLGATPVTLGGDEAKATFFVAGAAPVALRYFVEGERVVCEDAVTGERAAVEPDVGRPLGRVTVTLRGADTSGGTGFVLEVAGRPLRLRDGMPLTPEDVAGLLPRGADGMVAIVGKGQDGSYVLRNRSGTAWKVRGADGGEQAVEPGRSFGLAHGARVDFGPSRGEVRRDG